MWQQQLPELDLSLGDYALPLVPGKRDAGRLARRMQQNELNDVDDTLRSQTLLM